MSEREPSNFSDEELIEEASRIKPSPLIDACFIGFLVGIIIFSVSANTWGLVTLIPLFLIYLLLKKSDRYSALRNEMKDRGLQ